MNNLGNPSYVAPPPLKHLPVLAGPSKARSKQPVGPLSEEQRRRNLDELAALGVAMPASYVKENAMAGEWQTVRVIDEPVTRDEMDGQDERDENVKKEDGEGDGGTEMVVAGGGGLGEKRKLADGTGEEADEDEEEMRRFKVRTREYPVDGTVEGLDDLLAGRKMEWKGRKKARGAVPEDKNLLRRNDPTDDVVKKNEIEEEGPVIKQEVETPNVNEEEMDTPAPSVAFAFKKRKTKNVGRGALA